MQSGGLARFARDVLTKPCCCRGPIPPIVEGLQYISAQRCFTTSDLPSTSSARIASADPANAAAVSAAAQHPEAVARDTAKMAYEADMRKLRRKWQAQHTEKLAIKAKAEAVKNANKAVTIEAHRHKVAQMKELRMQIHEEKRRLQIAELVGSLALCCCSTLVICKIHCSFASQSTAACAQSADSTIIAVNWGYQSEFNHAICAATKHSAHEIAEAASSLT